MAEPLNAEALVELQEGHKAVGSTVSQFCDYCEQNWPCDTAYLLASLDAAIREQDQAQKACDEALSEAEYWVDRGRALTARSEVLTEARGGEVKRDSSYDCQECGQRCEGADHYHPYLYCVLYKAGIRDQAAFLNSYGWARSIQGEESKRMKLDREASAALVEEGLRRAEDAAFCVAEEDAWEGWLRRNATTVLFDAQRSLSALAVAEEALESFVDERHTERQGSKLCDWCGSRWPCDYEDAREAVAIIRGTADLPEEKE